MHEMGIVQNIMDILLQQMAMHNVRKLVRVNLEFGILTAVQPDSIQFAFKVLSEGTQVENAELHVTIIPLKVRCMDCGEVHVLERYEPFCPSCESAGLQILEGRDEMRIASLEVED